MTNRIVITAKPPAFPNCKSEAERHVARGLSAPSDAALKGPRYSERHPSDELASCFRLQPAGDVTKITDQLFERGGTGRRAGYAKD